MPNNIDHYSCKIIGSEIKHAMSAIKSGWICSGNYISKFESQISRYLKVKYAIATNSGTSALHISLISSGIKENDEVILPSITFISTANVIKYCNASPIFMDVDDFYNIDKNKTLEFIKTKTIMKNGFCFNKISKKRIFAIMPVHVWGNACDLEEILSICKKKNIKIIEDAAESLGTKYLKGRFKMRHTGTIGDVGCLSFNVNKIVTTGNGGMIVTNDPSIALKARYLINQAKNNDIYYIHEEVGFHYRMNNVLAAIGYAQFKNLNNFINNKKFIYQSYLNGLNNLKYFRVCLTPKYSDNNNWQTILKILPNKQKVDNKYLINYLKKNNIGSRAVWFPNHLQKQFLKSYSYKVNNAQKLVKNSVCLPSGNHITKKNLIKIILLIKKLDKKILKLEKKN